MFSTFVETTNIRLNGVYPDLEFKTVPLLASRLMNGGNKSLQKGEIWVPDLMSTSMKVKLGDTVVIIATNKDGSVNGKQFKVAGVLGSATGPGGRDGYIHIEDAVEVLHGLKTCISGKGAALFGKTEANTVKNQTIIG